MELIKFDQELCKIVGGIVFSIMKSGLRYDDMEFDVVIERSEQLEDRGNSSIPIKHQDLMYPPCLSASPYSN